MPLIHRQLSSRPFCCSADGQSSVDYCLSTWTSSDSRTPNHSSPPRICTLRALLPDSQLYAPRWRAVGCCRASGTVSFSCVCLLRFQPQPPLSLPPWGKGMTSSPTGLWVDVSRRNRGKFPMVISSDRWDSRDKGTCRGTQASCVCLFVHSSLPCVHKKNTAEPPFSWTPLHTHANPTRQAAPPLPFPNHDTPKRRQQPSRRCRV